MEEERRLCYVGMTRAEKKLYLSWARYRRRFGGGQPEASIPSRFLKEVPPALLDRVRGDHRGTWILYAERTRSAKRPGETSILGRLTTRWRTSGSFSPRRGCRRRKGWAQRHRRRRSQWRQSRGVTAPVRKAAKKLDRARLIEHAKYGRGTVLRLEGSGEDTKVTVSFPGYGLKKLIAKYAGIKIE